MNNIPKPIPSSGLYLYTNAVDDIAIAQKFDDSAKAALMLEMAAGIRAGELIVRKPDTSGPFPIISPSMKNVSSLVTIVDVNSWLNRKGYQYEWELSRPTIKVTPQPLIPGTQVNSDDSNGDDTEPKRHNRLYGEILEIESYKTIGQPAIRKILVTYIGKDGSCIKSLSDDSISWIDWQGNKQVTTNNSLGTWLRRQERHKADMRQTLKA